MTRSTVIPLLTGLLAACAGPVTKLAVLDRGAVLAEQRAQQQLVLASQRALLARLQTNAWPILAANADLCGKAVRKSLGITLADAGTTARDVKGLRKSDVENAGFSGIEVAAVAAGSPAALAGVKPGEKLAGSSAQKAGEALQSAFKEKGAVTLDFADGHKLSLTPASICRFPVRLSLSNSINAYTDGSTLVIHAGLLNAVSDDRQIRFVIAHELAHAMLKHPRKGITNSLISGGWLLGTVAGTTGWLVDTMRDLIGTAGPIRYGDAGAKLSAWPYGKTFEREADYVALYLLARSGEPLDDVEGIYSTFSKTGPLSTWFGISHPITPERIVAVRQTRVEIESKRKANAAMLPEGWPASQAMARDSSAGTPPAR